MNSKCTNCGNNNWRVESSRTVHYDVPQLAFLTQLAVDYSCQSCGKVQRSLWDEEVPPPVITHPHEASQADVKHKRAHVAMVSPSGSRLISIQYPAVSRAGENLLIPTLEGNIQDGTSVDRYGKPDLMIEFAEEYLKHYFSVLPRGRLPNALKEVMPALLLLFTAAELAIKAYLIRSGRQIQTNHSLKEPYEKLDPEHRKEIERRFAESNGNTKLLALGVSPPKVVDILSVYSNTYGGTSNIHMDARYYAEPTTMFRPKDSLHGATLLKSGTPYPIFLPDVVGALIDAYQFYSGAERLRRRGADVKAGFRDTGNNNHGAWGLIPNSLNLVVIVVSQQAGKSAEHEDLRIFNEFRILHPTDFHLDWMYGGNNLLFYRDGGQELPDGERVIEGLNCRVWRKNRMGMHGRDLYLLAAALDGSTKDKYRIGLLTNIVLRAS